jgi:NAD(P)H dehydrogenase (quinone)
MKHAVIVAHPNPKSLVASIAGAYADVVRSVAHTAIVRDLYALGFNPCLQAGEIPGQEGFHAGDDVAAERALLKDVDVFAFVYPVWFNAPPAILTGYMQRVFGMGFGYGPIHQGGNEPLLGGRSLISFSTSGAPKEWFESEGGWQALQNLFDKHFAAVCGMRVIGHTHFGRISAQMRPDAVDHVLEEAKRVTLEGCGG